MNGLDASDAVQALCERQLQDVADEQIADGVDCLQIVPRVDGDIDLGRTLAADLDQRVLRRSLPIGSERDCLLDDCTELLEQLVACRQSREIHIVRLEGQDDGSTQIGRRRGGGSLGGAKFQDLRAHLGRDAAIPDLLHAWKDVQALCEVPGEPLQPVFVVDVAHNEVDNLVRRRHEAGVHHQTRRVIAQTDVLGLDGHIDRRSPFCEHGPHSSFERLHDGRIPQERPEVYARHSDG